MVKTLLIFSLDKSYTGHIGEQQHSALIQDEGLNLHEMKLNYFYYSEMW